MHPRRARWAFRLIFFPALIAGAVLLLAGRSSGAGLEWVDGTTSQGGQLQAQLVDGRLDGDALSGTVRSVEHFDEPGYGPYDCDSGPITFSARAD